MTQAAPTRLSRLVADTEPERLRVRQLAASGRWDEAEQDEQRRARYVQRHVLRNRTDGAERIQGATDDLQPARFLPLGSDVRRAVGYVEVTSGAVSEAGSGFLISPRLFLTNAHVLPDPSAAAAAAVTFDRELNERGERRVTTGFRLAPDRLAVFSDSEHLDYAVVAVGDRTTGTATVEELGFCPLSDRDDKHAIGMPVNIIQHPRGWLKMIAVRNNLLVIRTEQTLLYESDTETGSSGSPVFNDDWEVIALHHWGEPHLERVGPDGRPFPLTVNEGIRISAIYRDLVATVDDGNLTEPQRALLREALRYADRPSASTGRVLNPAPETGSDRPPAAGVERERRDTTMDSGELRVTVPLEISIRVGTPVAAGAPIGRPAPNGAVPSLAAEGAKLDPDYSNREGYDPGFIAGHTLALPKLKAALRQKVAPLRPDAANGDRSGELRYEHFSVIINKATRLAIFTATNIDGRTYLEVDRATGRVAGPESDRWFNDDRIDSDHVLGQAFYSEWSIYFDRGHLTRRTDPTWGSPTEAERANADTFHFTNCSPQHFRFNQKAKYWQGLERYVLENGVLKTDRRKRLCVFQGPLFAGNTDRQVGGVQIPSSYWKIVVWQGRDTLKAVGLVADQEALLDEERHSLGQPQELASVDVDHWRVPIPTIEDRTGLDFGAAIRAADTIRHPDQPDVGEEAAVRITSFDQIRL